MKVQWLGHASFLIETGGRRIITDPFDEALGYPAYGQEADIVTVSHDHWDHNAASTVKGHPQIIRETGTFNIEEIQIKGIASFHDQLQGRQRGANIIYRLQSENISLVHLGDLGHLLHSEQLKELGQVNILLIPVGGTFTIDAGQALAAISQLKPAIVIPMHYNTPHLSFSLAPVESFTAQFDRVIKKPYLEVDAQDLTKEMKIVVLDYLC